MKKYVKVFYSTLGTRASKFKWKEIGKRKREQEERSNFLSFLIFFFLLFFGSGTQGNSTDAL